MMVLLISFYIIFPAVAIWLCHRFPFINKIGVVILCYLVGITIGNTGIIPRDAFAIQQIISEAAVAMAMPLLLFSLDVKRWLKMAGKAIFCMAGAALSIILVTGCGLGDLEDDFAGCSDNLGRQVDHLSAQGGGIRFEGPFVPM